MVDRRSLYAETPTRSNHADDGPPLRHHLFVHSCVSAMGIHAAARREHQTMPATRTVGGLLVSRKSLHKETPTTPNHADDMPLLQRHLYKQRGLAYLGLARGLGSGDHELWEDVDHVSEGAAVEASDS